MTDKKNIYITLISLFLLALTVLIIIWMFSNKPESRKRLLKELPLLVDAQPLKSQSYQVLIQSYGNVQAVTRGELVAQVSGLINKVSEKFASGNYFEQGDVLATIESKDYAIEVTIIEAELASAQLALEEEIARASQAKRDWQKINASKVANPLVLREPQIASAKAKLAAASAKLAKAKLALARTEVKAPYAGYIIEKKADLGQLVNSNTAIASIFSSNSLEVRLPVPSNKVQFLPEFNTSADGAEQNISLSANFGGMIKRWPANLNRADSIIDDTTRQWFVIAKLSGDILKQEPLLKVGQFVNADIKGKLLQEVFVIPSKLIYDDNIIYLVENERLKKHAIEPIWQSDDMTIVKSGLQDGQLLIRTPLSFVADGVKVRLNQAIDKDLDKAPGDAIKQGAQ